MAFRVAPQAESDLDEIWYFLATQSSSIDVADRLIDSSDPSTSRRGTPAPTIKLATARRQAEGTDEDPKTVVGFRLAYVFDVMKLGAAGSST